jgi:hypothetical protein
LGLSLKNLGRKIRTRKISRLVQGKSSELDQREGSGPRNSFVSRGDRPSVIDLMEALKKRLSKKTPAAEPMPIDIDAGSCQGSVDERPIL